MDTSILAIKSSKLDIDMWKVGNKSNIKRDEDKPEVERHSRTRVRGRYEL